MAQIAQVVVLNGNAIVVGLDGATRPLKPGAAIEKGETLRTLAGASVELLLNDGQSLSLAPGQALRLDDSLAQSDSTPTAQESSVQLQTPEAVLQVLQKGGNLDDQLEDPGAGSGTGGGGDGSSFVRLLRIAEGVEPLSYEYGIAGLQQIDDIQLENPGFAADVTVQSVTSDLRQEGQALVHLVTLSGETGVATTFSLSLGGGTATKGLDYDAAPIFSDGVKYDPSAGTIKVPSGVSSFTVTVASQDDMLVESGEHYEFSVGGQSATGTIVDTDVVTVSITGDATVNEGATASYVVSLAGGTLANDQSVSVRVATGPGQSLQLPDATAGVDYDALTQTLTFKAGGPGETHLNVVTLDDPLVEGPEAYQLSLADPVGAAIGTSSVTTRIVDLDSLTVSITGDATVNEGATASYVVSLAGGTLANDQSVSVRVATGPGQSLQLPDATAGVDYDALTQTLTFKAGGPGETHLNVVTLDDPLVEGPEAYQLSLADPVGAAIGTGSVTTRIVDNDTAPLVGDGLSRVSEEGLTGGIQDADGSQPSPNGNDRTNSTRDLDGTLAITRNGSAPLTVEWINPAPLQVGATPLSWAYDGTNHAVLIGSDARGEVIRVTLNGGLVDVGSSGATVPYGVELLRPVEHLTAGHGTAGEDSASLNLRVRISDGVNPPDTGTITVVIEDDSPVITAADVTAPGTLAVDETDLATSAQAGFADRFASAIDYGADGAGSTAYSLVLAGANVGSGLYALGAHGARGGEIVLNQSGNTVTGSFGATTYFTIGLDPASGELTLDQLAAIYHADSGNPDDVSSLATAAHALLLRATVTDSDGDTAHHDLDLGAAGVFQFRDDGPTNGADFRSARPELLLDESLLPPGGDGIHSQTYQGQFTHWNAGADGGSVSYRLELSLNGAVSPVDGVGSGLYALDRSDLLASDGDGIGKGAEILLFRNAQGAIEGRTSAGGEVCFTLGVGASDGSVTFTQSKNIWHPDPQQPDEPLSLLGNTGYSLQMTQTVTDADGDTSTAAINLRFGIEDDGPKASPQIADAQAVQPVETNLMLMLDVSDSMNSPSGYQDYTRLQVLQKSALELLDRYEALGQVRVNLVTFASGADNPTAGWVSVPEAKAFIEGLSTAGGTNYDAALNMAWNSYLDHDQPSDSNPMLAGVRTVSYFLSDGSPTTNSIAGTGNPNGALGGGNGVDAAEQSDWQGFLTQHAIKSYALGMGSSVNSPALEPVAYDGAAGQDLPVTLVTDFSTLADKLVETVLPPPLKGQLVKGVDIALGTDGGTLWSVTVDGLNYDRLGHVTDAVTDQVVAGHGSWNGTDQSWTIGTAGGAVFTIRMADQPGYDYQYQAPAGSEDGLVETLGYTLRDADGDQASSTLTFFSDPALAPTVVRDDHVIANPQADLVIPAWALLANDTAFRGTAQQVRSVSPDGGPLLLGQVGGAIHLVSGFDYSPGLGFSYVNSQQAGEPVRVSLQAGDGDLVGSYRDDILILGDGEEFTSIAAGDGDDVLLGNRADNHLSGGNGDDILVGAAGDDTLDGGADDGRGDTASYLDAPGDGAGSGVVATLGTGGASGTATGAGVGTDALIGIENLTGSAYRDTLTGNELANRLDGGRGDDMLLGAAGQDSLTGGTGNDTLAGGLGADVFRWTLADQGTSAVPAIDRLLDFTPGQGDALDLRDLLAGEHRTDGLVWNLDQYLHFGTEGGQLALLVDPDGAGTGGVTQKIVLDSFASQDALSFALTGSAGLHDAELVSKLVDQGNLKLDP